MKGRPAASLKDEAKTFAERMGYHWLENCDAGVRFDGLMYREAVMVAVKLTKIRYGLDTDCIIENKFPDEVADLRTLPLPYYVLRELWVRTQNERAYRRFYILPDTTAEIEENTRENYRNTHFREAYWKKAPFRIDIPLRKKGDEGG
ncbi:MAG TPA: hypothetical protein HA272_09405 [Methanoregula sp.]|nr:hypothetical protein [Methanoregula sp.]